MHFQSCTTTYNLTSFQVTINGKTHSVHMGNAQAMSVPIVYFVTIEDNIQVIPAKYIRRDPDYAECVIVTYKGREFQISITECTMMDGRPMQLQDIPDENAAVYGGPGAG